MMLMIVMVMAKLRLPLFIIVVSCAILMMMKTNYTSNAKKCNDLTGKILLQIKRTK